MALHKGCVYYYEKDLSRTEIEGVSLFGFKSVQVATECTDNKALWAFKLVHRHPSVFCSQYFSAASENDLKFWISVFKKELRNANGEEVPSEYQEQENDYECYGYNGGVDIRDTNRQTSSQAGSRVVPNRPLPLIPPEYNDVVDRVAFRRSLPLPSPLSPGEVLY
ncbi:Hypothetical predicted protein, partial [Mytilus galloprovincialis]